MKIITINDVEYAVFAANEGTSKPQPHIIETKSGTIPEGKCSYPSIWYINF